MRKVKLGRYNLHVSRNESSDVQSVGIANDTLVVSNNLYSTVILIQFDD